MKERIDRLLHDEGGKGQLVRFILTGSLAAGIHYGIYLLLYLFFLWQVVAVNEYIGIKNTASFAYAVGYLVSFAVNFYITCIFTFQTMPSWSHFIGFACSHGVNFLLHIVLFWICVQLGVHYLIAPIVVMGIAMIVQFTILRFVFRKK